MRRHLVSIIASSALATFVGGALASARADGPARRITPDDATQATCFGYVGSEAMYAVRLKSSCDAATGKCEVASYLARVTPDGLTKTVAYLTYWKGDGMPAQSQLAATAKAGVLDKALGEMADATMACEAVVPGKTFSYDDGRRTGTVSKLDDGSWIVRGDNLQSQVFPKGIDAIFVAPHGNAWTVHRTTNDGTTADAAFERVFVDVLLKQPPRTAASKAIQLTAQNVATEQCLGWRTADDTMYYAAPEVAGSQAISRLYEVSGPGVRPYEVVRRPLPFGITSPQIGLATVVPNELALANDHLAGVDAGCLSTPLEAGKTLTVPARGTTVEVTRTGSELKLLGPDGARVSLSIGMGGGGATLVRADGTDTRWYVKTLDGGTVRFTPIALEPVFAKPTVFPLPTTVATPVCYTSSSGLAFILSFSRTPGAGGDTAELTLRREGARPSIESLAKVTLASTDPDDAILAKVTRDRRIELASSFGEVKACELLPIGADGNYMGRDVAYTLKADGDAWGVGRADRNALVPLGKGLGTPRFAIHTTVVFAKAGPAKGWEFATFEPGAWELLPDPPELAAKVPKLLKDKVPGNVPAQKRCLAWNSKDRVAWVVRPTGDCVGGGEEGGCSPMSILTEVRKDGYYKRVTLSKDGDAWAHMFEQANTLMAKADLGCVDGPRATILGVPVEVSVDDDKIMVEANGKKQRVDGLVDAHDDGNDLSESFENVFWHPDVNVLVIEVRTSSTNSSDRRYVYVDLARFGIKPTK